VRPGGFRAEGLEERGAERGDTGAQRDEGAAHGRVGVGALRESHQDPRLTGIDEHLDEPGDLRSRVLGRHRRAEDLDAPAHSLLGDGEQQVGPSGEVVSEVALTQPGALRDPRLGEAAEPVLLDDVERCRHDRLPLL